MATIHEMLFTADRDPKYILVSLAKTPLPILFFAGKLPP
jgi:hypothetical protein